MESAKTAYTKLIEKIAKLNPNDEKVDFDAFEKLNNQFKEAISNDLNTSLAITCVYDTLKANTNDATKVALILSFNEVLSLDFDKALLGNHELLKKQEVIVESELETYILEKIEERKQAKKLKDFAKADSIRAELLEKGIELIDTREGTTYKIK